MKPERWREVRQILDEAIPLSIDKRSLYLERVCTGDPELRAEVVSLLESHDQAGPVFLNSPVADLSAVVEHPESTRVGRRVGAYQIIEEIARGGMGEVYRAVRADGEYDKQVAIKLIRIGLDTRELVDRFRHERQILATLDHPNIARLLDAGTTEDGIPYLVMELIEGTPIDQYCDKKALGVDERLQLFRQACLAVQYAHQRLVIHRDIKPSNILVTADGTPKLLDFGIAKILDPAAGTETTQLRPMTPEYASPEQVRGGPITTATDIYSLGVLLYRTLTGYSPYPGTNRAATEIARAICEREPARPSTAAKRAAEHGEHTSGAASGSLWHKLKGDIDNIVLKTLRKEPERRYASAEQLAEDLRRHLEGLPVAATPDSIPYRFGKFVRRHQTGVAATALIILIIGAGVAATVREARIAIQERARAERRFNDVRKLANSVLFEFDDKIRDLPGSMPARSLVVKRALEYLDGLALEARGDHSLQLEIAAAYQKVAEVQGDPMFPNLGDSKGALESSRKALSILENLSHEDPGNDQIRLALAKTHQEISDVLQFSGDAVGAVQNSGDALNLYEGLATKLLADPKFQTELLTQTYQYANLLKLDGHLDESVAQYKKAVELSQRMITANPANQEGKIHLATSLDGLGNVLQEKGDTAGALENRRHGLAIREELTKLDPNNAHFRRQFAFSHHNVGLSLVEAGDLASALANFRQELALFESLRAADPKDVQARRNCSLANKQIGDVLMHTNDARGALAQYRAALDIDRELVSLDPANYQAALDLSFSESKFGSALGKLGKTRPGLNIQLSGIARQESLLTRDSHHILLYNHLANSYTLLANSLLAAGDEQGAVGYFRKAVVARLTLTEKSPNSISNRGALAECYVHLGKALAPIDRDEALKQDNNAIDLLDRLTAGDRSNAKYRITLADALSNAADLYARIAGQLQDSAARFHSWTKAKLFYQRSQDLWLELSRTGKLPPARRQATREVSDQIALCNDSLAELQRAH